MGAGSNCQMQVIVWILHQHVTIRN